MHVDTRWITQLELSFRWVHDESMFSFQRNPIWMGVLIIMGFWCRFPYDLGLGRGRVCRLLDPIVGLEGVSRTNLSVPRSPLLHHLPIVHVSKPHVACRHPKRSKSSIRENLCVGIPREVKLLWRVSYRSQHDGDFYVDVWLKIVKIGFANRRPPRIVGLEMLNGHVLEPFHRSPQHVLRTMLAPFMLDSPWAKVRGSRVSFRVPSFITTNHRARRYTR